MKSFIKSKILINKRDFQLITIPDYIKFKIKNNIFIKFSWQNYFFLKYYCRRLWEHMQMGPNLCDQILWTQMCTNSVQLYHNNQLKSNFYHLFWPILTKFIEICWKSRQNFFCKNFVNWIFSLNSKKQGL